MQLMPNLRHLCLYPYYEAYHQKLVVTTALASLLRLEVRRCCAPIHGLASSHNQHAVHAEQDAGDSMHAAIWRPPSVLVCNKAYIKCSLWRPALHFTADLLFCI